MARFKLADAGDDDKIWRVEDILLCRREGLCGWERTVWGWAGRLMFGFGVGDGLAG